MNHRSSLRVWIALPGLACCFLSLAILQESTNALHRYPELEGVDPAIEADLRKVWNANEGAGLSMEKGPPEVVSKARSIGRKAALPLIKIIVEEYEKKDRSVVKTAMYWNDATAEPLFACLADLAEASASSVLIRILEDAEAHEELRRGAVIALAWPGNTDALRPLLERALDRQEKNDLRAAILRRLPRLRVSPPARLRDLLQEPFGHIDQLAAGALVLMGDPEAPSLVVEGLKRHWWPDPGDGFLIEAASALTQGEIPFQLPANGIFGDDELQRVRSWLDEWLARHPESLETGFEKARRAYLSEAERLACEGISVASARAEALSIAGRTDEAFKVLDAAEKHSPEALADLRLTRVALEARRDPARARSVIEEASPDNMDEALAAARALLHPALAQEAAPHHALALLQKVSKLAEEKIETMTVGEFQARMRKNPVFRTIPPVQAREYYLLRARALLLLGKPDEARKALKAVEADNFVNRDVLELQRDLVVEKR